MLRVGSVCVALVVFLATLTTIDVPVSVAAPADGSRDARRSTDRTVPDDVSLTGITLPTEATNVPSLWHLDRLAGTTTVEILNASEPDATSARRAVEAAGGAINDTAPSGVMLARVPTVNVGELVTELGGRIRRPVDLDVRPERSNPEIFGAASGSEVVITNADDWQAAGLTGAGVRVGVIDFFDVSAYWNLGEMGPAPIANVTARCIAEGVDCSSEFFDGIDGGGDDHGPAVVEV
ncbi:MAG TPA: hypothetical protein VFV63_10930, partial [Ilumatobacteraceae bacterium]|nr:hypothetical protein [Ilumatobacteraceae bacterium]